MIPEALSAFSSGQWLVGIGAGILVGFSKTGIPGVGILVVPLLALVFQDQGRLAVGAMLPMLLVGDCFAVAWYRRHTRWDKLWQLLPSVLVGMAIGAVTLWQLGQSKGKDALNPILGVLVLVMLLVHVARLRWGSQVTLTSPTGAAMTGGAAGFATTVSNAAGPIMSIYMTNLGLEKAEFMGTTAWYYFMFNSIKVPIFLALTHINPTKPMFNATSLWFDLAMCPIILCGVYIGRWLLPRISQRKFDDVVLVLAAIAAVNLIYPVVTLPVKPAHAAPVRVSR